MTLVVTIVEGIAGATYQWSRRNGQQPGRSLHRDSVLATREVGLVGSINSIGELGLVITSRPVVAGVEDMTGMEIEDMNQLRLGLSLFHYWVPLLVW